MAKLTTVILIQVDTETNENVGMITSYATMPGQPQEFQSNSVKCDADMFKNIETIVTDHAKKYGTTFGS